MTNQSLQSMQPMQNVVHVLLETLRCRCGAVRKTFESVVSIWCDKGCQLSTLLVKIHADPDISICFWNSNNRSRLVCRCVDRHYDVVDNHLVEFRLYFLQKRNRNTSRNCLTKWLSIVLEFNVLFTLEFPQSPEELRVPNLYIFL